MDNINCINVGKLDKSQLIDGIELQQILSCGGILMVDSSNPIEDNLFVVYINTGKLRISKVKL